jgi:thioredoxin reductase
MARPLERFDAAVVGGGPAGLSAATWLARYRTRVLVLDSGEYRNEHVEQAHGYFGFDPADPAELRQRARDGLAQYPEANLREGRATAARRNDDGTFDLDLADGATVRTKRLVLATGVSDEFPEVDNFFEHYGASVFHCPTCDGYEAKDKAVVAFGWSEEVTGFALTLLGWAASVTVVTDGRRFEGDDECRARLSANGVPVLEDDAVAFVGSRGDLQAVRLRGGREIPCQVAFFAIAHRFHAELADQLGCERTDEGCVVVDGEGCTSVPGVYGAGDLVPGLHLVQVAAAQGAIAGVACARSLRGEGGIREEWNGEVPGYTGPMTEQRDPEVQLDELEHEIEDVRHRVDAEEGVSGPHFIDDGAADQGEPVDDAIAPPG